MRSLANEGLFNFFDNFHGILCPPKIVVVNEGVIVLDICTKLKENKRKIKKWKKRKKEGEEKKIMAALLVFMLSSLKTEFETKKLFDGRDLFWLYSYVIVQKSN